MYTRQIVPSALPEFNRISIDYAIGEEMYGWCDQITTEAGTSKRYQTELTEVRMQELRSTLDSKLSNRINGWDDPWDRLKRSGVAELAKGLSYFLSTMKKPWEVATNMRTFPGLSGSVPVEVEAVYGIDHADQKVVFFRFESYTPAVLEDQMSYASAPHNW